MHRVNPCSVPGCRYHESASVFPVRTANGFRSTMESCGREIGFAGQTQAGTAFQHTRRSAKEIAVGVLTHFQERNTEINDLLTRVVIGSRLDPGDSLALQGMMLNFSRDITAVTKVVESIVNAIKTAVQTQV